MLLYYFFDLFRFVQGVNNDVKKTLFAKKEYLIHTYLKGKVISKELCDKCPELKWEVIIQIDTINEPFLSNRMNRVYQPYYEFEKDTLLYIKIPQNVYNRIEVGNILVKDSGSTYININNKENFQFLSKNHNKWFHDK